MHGYMSTGGVQFNGGIVGVDADCNVTKTFWSIESAPTGKLTSHFELADQGCLTPHTTPTFFAWSTLRIVADCHGRRLYRNRRHRRGRVGARWFDARGSR